MLQWLQIQLVASGDLESLAKLLKQLSKGGSLSEAQFLDYVNNIGGECGMTALHHAVQSHNLYAVKLLSKYSAGYHFLILRQYNVLNCVSHEAISVTVYSIIIHCF